ncbi:MAG: rhodanese-like domain-containing protein [Candidatus Acidiferrales bacterium]
MHLKIVRGAVTVIVGVLFLVLFAANSRTLRRGNVSVGAHGASVAAGGGEPWSDSQTIQPAELAKELAATPAGDKPVVVCVGFHALYQGAHVPGALFHGAASTEHGIADLRNWAQGVAKSSKVVLYCGCCPLAKCPNIRPAFTALRDMGFSNLRVLLLPQDFNTDWIEKGYPVEKGK